MFSEPPNTANLFDVHGLVAVITGGGTGIGLMMANALAHNGATVYIVGRRLAVLQKAAQENENGRIIAIQGDVTSKDSLEYVVNRIKEQTGYINLLVNNSAIYGPTSREKPPTKEQTAKEYADFYWDRPIEDFTRIFEVNVAGVFYTTLAFLDLLDAGNQQGRGIEGVSSQVITVSSVGGLRRDKDVDSWAYNSSKAAVIHLGKSLASVLPQVSLR